MTFQTVPLNITGPTYKDRSKPLSAQETRNVYHEIVDGGKNAYVLKSFPGQQLLGLTTAGKDRGMHRMSEIAYRVVDDILYQVDSLGVHINRGQIPGSSRCIFANDGVNMYIVADGFVRQYNNVTLVVTAVTNPNINGAMSIAFINNQFAYTFPLLTVFTEVGDGTSATSLNAVGEESVPDDLVRDYTFDQTLYRFSTLSCAIWYNSGVGIPPFSRVEGSIINVGLKAIHSVTNSQDFVYWLGSDNQIYRARGGQEQVVSTAAVSGAIAGYIKTDDAFAYVFTIDDLVIYILTFPEADKTWCLIEKLGKDGWFELSAGIGDGAYNAGSILEVYDKILVGDSDTGQLYNLDFNTYDQAGLPWRRRRVIASLNANLFKQRGKRIQVSRMEFIMETGTGLSIGQGDDPKIMLEYSLDGARSWSQGTWLKIGRLGQFDIRVEWFSLISFYDLIVRLTTSDAVAYNIYSASVDVRLAGR